MKGVLSALVFMLAIPAAIYFGLKGWKQAQAKGAQSDQEAAVATAKAQASSVPRSTGNQVARTADDVASTAAAVAGSAASVVSVVKGIFGGGGDAPAPDVAKNTDAVLDEVPSFDLSF